MNDVTITTGASRVLEDLKAWGIKATSIWTHFDDSANEWWSFLGRRSSHLAAPLRRGSFVFGGLSLPKIPSSLQRFPRPPLSYAKPARVAFSVRRA
jgi:hypothetical protein